MQFLRSVPGLPGQCSTPIGQRWETCFPLANQTKCDRQNVGPCNLTWEFMHNLSLRPSNQLLQFLLQIPLGLFLPNKKMKWKFDLNGAKWIASPAQSSMTPRESTLLVLWLSLPFFILLLTSSLPLPGLTFSIACFLILGTVLTLT